MQNHSKHYEEQYKNLLQARSIKDYAENANIPASDNETPPSNKSVAHFESLDDPGHSFGLCGDNSETEGGEEREERDELNNSVVCVYILYNLCFELVDLPVQLCKLVHRCIFSRNDRS